MEEKLKEYLSTKVIDEVDLTSGKPVKRRRVIKDIFDKLKIRVNPLAKQRLIDGLVEEILEFFKSLPRNEDELKSQSEKRNKEVAKEEKEADDSIASITKSLKK